MSSSAPATVVWGKACLALRRELGEADFGSWLAQAALRIETEGLTFSAAQCQEACAELRELQHTVHALCQRMGLVGTLPPEPPAVRPPPPARAPA